MTTAMLFRMGSLKACLHLGARDEKGESLGRRQVAFSTATTDSGGSQEEGNRQSSHVRDDLSG